MTDEQERRDGPLVRIERELADIHSDIRALRAEIGVLVTTFEGDFAALQAAAQALIDEVKSLIDQVAAGASPSELSQLEALTAQLQAALPAAPTDAPPTDAPPTDAPPTDAP